MVSLIITTYNYGHYVERAIRSGLEQTLQKSQYEIIVVNDASTDQTARILEAYQPEVRVFNLEQNGGLAAARNFGVQKARGQFILFLDADDYHPQRAVARSETVSRREQHHRCGILGLLARG
jgi:glycosyltransferase involved in cell wall biosynthesis